MSPDSKKQTMNPLTKRLIWVAVIIIAYFAISNMLPVPDLGEKDGVVAVKAIALMVCAVLAWVSNCIPIAISSLFFVFAQHLAGVTPMGPATKEFINPTLFFVIASFVLAIAFSESGFNKRVSLKLTMLSKGNPKMAVFWIYFACATVSTVISDIPAAAAFVPVALAIIDNNNLKPGSNLAKSLMIGIGLAALIGGVATPAGSSMNVMAIGLLKSTADIDVSFLQWATVGIPVVVISYFCMPVILNFCFPPEMKELAGMDQINDQYKALGPMSTQEKKFVIIFALLLITWFTESIHKMPVQLTAVIGATIMFFPGIDILTWEGSKNRIGWDLFLLMGAGNSLGGALWNSGAAEWMSNSALSGIVGQSAIIVILFVIIFTVVIHLIVPVNPAIVSIMVPTLVAFAIANGMNPTFLVIPMAFSVSGAFLLPLDPVPLIPYGSGHFTFGDFFKSGVVTSIWWTVVVAVCVFIFAPMVGLF